MAVVTVDLGQDNLAKMVGFNNGTFKINIKEYGVYSVRVSSPGFLTSSKNVTFNCDATKCDDCINEVDFALTPDVCKSADFTLTVTGSNSRTPIKNANVKVTDISKPSQPKSLANERTD